MGQPKRATTSLVDFAVSNPVSRGSGCTVCSLDERAELDTAKRAGAASVTQMIGWLAERGHQVSRAKLNHHFTSSHHEAAVK